jgi:hypothetical protein
MERTSVTTETLDHFLKRLSHFVSFTLPLLLLAKISDVHSIHWHWPQLCPNLGLVST